MQVDSAVIPHLQLDVIPFPKLRELLKIEPQILQAKPTWYQVNGKLNYFKERNDLRIFAELFYHEYAKETLKLDTLIYQLAYVREIKSGQPQPEAKLGLLSPNFQTDDKNYYLGCELMDPENSDLCSYGSFNLMDLLRFFKDYLIKTDYERVKDFLIRLFIVDALLLQVDRNYRNLGFEIPAVEGLSHTKRLRPTLLSQSCVDCTPLDCQKKYKYHLKGEAASNNCIDCQKIVQFEDGVFRLKGFTASKVYDNERILNIKHFGKYVVNPNGVWVPSLPFNSGLNFSSIMEAELKANTEYDNCDPNLLELCFEFYDECKSYLEELAFNDIHRRILEKYSDPNAPLPLSAEDIVRFSSTIEQRQAAFKKVLRLAK